MSMPEYTVLDLESKLNKISNISLFLGTGDCPKEIAFNLHDHMQSEIESLQTMMSFMRLAPKIIAESKSKLESEALTA